ncbi:MAG: hypothetical protein OXC10_20075 [Rhodospirillaceae bacterium]|nr:hypothetical protein [Rhodospirillaceae bacterium]
MPDHIRIGDVSPRVQYVADGALRTFDFPFPIFDAGDLTVFLDEAEQRAGFTVDGAGGSRGGSVRFEAAPASGVRVTLQRVLAVERTTDFQEGGAFRADTINDELDRQTAMIQQIADQTARALTAAPTDPTVTLSLPPKDVRAGRYLAFDADGNAIASGGGPPATPVTPFAAGLLDDADAAAVRKTLGLDDLGALAALSAVDADQLAARVNPLGRHTVWAPAGAMTGETGSEPAIVARKLAGGLMLSALAFDAATPQHAQFALAMPKGWDAGDLTATRGSSGQSRSCSGCGSCRGGSGSAGGGKGRRGGGSGGAAGAAVAGNANIQWANEGVRNGAVR